MQVDYFKDILVPVIGGLGIFMLGLEFMSNGIQSLAVSRSTASTRCTSGGCELAGHDRQTSLGFRPACGR